MRKLMVLVALLVCAGCQSTSPIIEDRPARAAAPQLLFLVSEDPSNYEAHRTIPIFAETLQKEYGLRYRVIQAQGEMNATRFPGLEAALKETDLLVIFSRRRALPSGQMEAIRAYLKAGKPLVGIRTANHAFSVNGDVPVGFEKWWEFVPDVLGCLNRGYGQEKLGIDVTPAPHATGHPILKGVEPLAWHSNGSLYLVKPLVDQQATVLLNGTSGDKNEPIAWSRMYGSSRIFYTSLGYPADFEQPQFRRLLVNAIRWALEKQ